MLEDNFPGIFMGIGLIFVIYMLIPQKRLGPEEIEKEEIKIAGMSDRKLICLYYKIQTKIVRSKDTYADRLIYSLLEKELKERRLL